MVVRSRNPSRLAGLPPLPVIKHPLAAAVVNGEPNLAVTSNSRASSRQSSNLFNRNITSRASARFIENTVPLHNDYSTRDPDYGKGCTERSYTFRGAGQDAVDAEVHSPYVGDRGYVEINKQPKLRDQIRDVESRRPSRPSSRLSQSSSASSGVSLRLEVDEIESLLRDKCRNSVPEIQKLFRNNDPQGIGIVTREALQRIFVTLITRPISHLVFPKLLVRFGVESKNKYHVNDLLSSSTRPPIPHWITDVKKLTNDRAVLTANQVHTLLKERAQKRVFDLYDIIPQNNPDGARRLLKPEFKHSIQQILQCDINDEQFEKLWQRYDEQGVGVIDSKILSRKLGISLSDDDRPPSIEPKSLCLRKKEEDRQRSLTIEKWLKSRFRIGFNKMRSSFAKLDKSSTGVISPPEFCAVLAEHGLNLRYEHLDEFLARCGVVRSTNGVPYLAFLRSYQDRSEGGMPHKIISNPKHRYNAASEYSENISQSSKLSILESKLMTMLQKDFMSLLGQFHSLDEHKQGFVTKPTFRSAIESVFNVKLTDEQYSTFLDHVPLNRDGFVIYTEFMAQFDTRGECGSLMNGSIPDSEFPDPADVFLPSHRRSPDELSAQIRQLLTEDSRNVEENFTMLDCYSAQRLTQDDLFTLLNRCGIVPQVSRGEIRDLWSVMVTNRDSTVSWLQFLRQFSFTGQTHTYEDAGKNPPKFGDSDYFVKSNKLNSDFDYIKDTTRQNIEYKWDVLRRELTNSDPHQTGCTSEPEFSKILTDICIHLTVFDLTQIIKSCMVSDGRVNYVEFLTQFNPNKKPVWNRGNDMFNVLQHPEPTSNIGDVCEPPQKGLIGLSSRLRNKLSGNWKNLRRAFKKLDKESSGYLPLVQFRHVLQLANVMLDEDEVYHMMSSLDEDLTGKLDYNRFLNDLYRPESQRSSRASVRLMSSLSNASHSIT